MQKCTAALRPLMETYALATSTIGNTYWAKRTKWVEMKFEVRANIDLNRLFSDEAKVRISEKLASPTGFEQVYLP